MNKSILIILLIFFSGLSKGQQKTLWFQCRLGIFDGPHVGLPDLCLIDSLAGIMKQSNNQFLISRTLCRIKCDSTDELCDGTDELVIHINKDIFNEFRRAGVDAKQLVLPDKPQISTQATQYNFTIFELKKE